MALADMKVYNDDIVGTTIELLGQKLDVFNAASGGAIVLSAAGWKGDFSRESFFNQIASAKRRVDRYGANSAVTPTKLTQGEEVGVKVAGGFGPILFEPSQLTWLNENPSEAITAIAEGFADALLADQLNTAVAAAVAAVSGNTALVTENTATGSAGGINLGILNMSHAKFGDQSQRLITDLMTGRMYHTLIGKAIENGNNLFQSGNVTVVDVLGKRYVVSDIPALMVPATTGASPTPAKDIVLSLTSNAIVVDNASDIISNIETSNGKERIETTWQADYSYGLRLKGYSWDVTNGGKSPTDAELATSANWDKAVAEDKHTLGTLAIGEVYK